MEGNKEEAVRIFEVARSLVVNENYYLAKQMALEAQALDPEIKALPTMLATVEVGLAAEDKINGLVDYYRVLAVDPSDDISTIRKRYKKLCLVLHPDKTFCDWSAAAFKLISAANTTLGDNETRAAYDYQVGYNVPVEPVIHYWPQPGPSEESAPTATPAPHHSAAGPSEPAGPSHTGGPSAPPQQPSHTGGSSMPDRPRPHVRRSAKVPRTGHTPRATTVDEFYTRCKDCKRYFIYPKKFRNQFLECVKCGASFWAVQKFV